MCDPSILSSQCSIPVPAWPRCGCSILQYISKAWPLPEHSTLGNGFHSLIVVWQQAVEPDKDLGSLLQATATLLSKTLAALHDDVVPQHAPWQQHTSQQSQIVSEPATPFWLLGLAGDTLSREKQHSVSPFLSSQSHRIDHSMFHPIVCNLCHPSLPLVRGVTLSSLSLEPSGRQAYIPKGFVYPSAHSKLHAHPE